MKKVIFLPALLCLLMITGSYTAMAQEDQKPEFNTKKYQVNIGFADIFAKNYWWYSLWYIDEYGALMYPDLNGNYYRQPNLVLGFKCKGDKGAWRFGLNSRYGSTTYEDDDTTGSKNTFQNFGIALDAGYEWHSTFGRLNVYYGVDVSVSHTNYTYKYETFGRTYNRTEESKLNETAFGINPLLGINFFITPNFSIGTEVKFTAEYMSGKLIYEETHEEPYPMYPPDEKHTTKLSGIRTYFGPLGFLSLNIHL